MIKLFGNIPVLLFFNQVTVYQLPYNACQKHNNGSSINNVHNPEVKIGWPVWIFFAEEIHNSNLHKYLSNAKTKRPNFIVPKNKLIQA